VAELYEGDRLPDRFEPMVGRRSSAWWGALFGVIVLLSVLGYLVYSYFYLYVTAPEGAWPPAGIARPPLLLPGAAALAALAGTVPLRWVTSGWGDRDPLTLRRGLTGAAVMGVVTLAMVVVSAIAIDLGEANTAYRAIVLLLHGFAATVSLSGLAIAVVVAYQATTFESPTWVWSGGAVFEVWWGFSTLTWLTVLAVAYVWPQLV
jgi:cytochrome c oxidase subunit I+III